MVLHSRQAKNKCKTQIVEGEHFKSTINVERSSYLLEGRSQLWNNMHY